MCGFSLPAVMNERRRQGRQGSRQENRLESLSSWRFSLAALASWRSVSPFGSTWRPVSKVPAPFAAPTDPPYTAAAMSTELLVTDPALEGIREKVLADE